jgi:hypothetical protein
MPSLPLNEINQNEMQKIHLRGLNDDAYLINKPESNDAQKQSNQELNLSDKNNFNFMTEIFFACHKAIQLGFKSCYDRFLSLASNLSELSRAQLNNSRLPNQDMINTEMNIQLNRYYSTKTVLCQDDFIQLFIKFNMATSTWLTNLAMYSEHLTDNQQVDDLNINKFYPFKLKVDVNLEETRTSKLLQYVPEYICENVAEAFIFVQRFADNYLMINSTDFEPLFNFILCKY